MRVVLRLVCRTVFRTMFRTASFGVETFFPLFQESQNSVEKFQYFYLSNTDVEVWTSHCSQSS